MDEKTQYRLLVIGWALGMLSGIVVGWAIF